MKSILLNSVIIPIPNLKDLINKSKSVEVELEGFLSLLKLKYPIMLQKPLSIHVPPSIELVYSFSKELLDETIKLNIVFGLSGTDIDVSEKELEYLDTIYLEKYDEILHIGYYLE